MKTPHTGGRMARKPTITALAREAGLGVATIDRVLHDRPNVSPRARMQVAEAAVRIGYPLPAALRDAVTGSLPQVTLGFVLHKRGQTFYQRFAEEIGRACAARRDVGIRPQIRFAASQAPGDFAAEITALSDDCQAIAASAVNHASLSRLAGDLARRGLPVFSMLNDFAGSSGSGYLGLDNLRVGRLAGWMMATRLQAPGKVAVFVGGTRWHGQAMRDTGFRTYLRDHAPRINVLDTAVNLETRAVTYEATLDLLDRVPELSGLYVAGGGMEGAIAALRVARAPDRVTLIVNELTADSRRALAEGYVTMAIATPLEQLCVDLVDRMVGAVLSPDAKRPALRNPDPMLYLPESV